MSAWPIARLGDIARFQNGRAFKPSEWSPVGLPIIRIENLTNPSAQFNSYDGPVDERHLVGEGDLLVSWSASLDAFIWNRGVGVLNQHIFKVTEDASLLDRSYFFHALRHSMTAIRAQVHGATMQHITKPAFEAVTIPVPPLAEQRRIAARLRHQLAEVEALSAAAAARDAELAVLRNRAYEAAFPVTPLSVMAESASPDGWAWQSLGSLARLESGHTPSRSRSDWWGGDIPWIALPDIRALDGRHAFETQERTNPEGIAHSAARVLPAGTVVLSRTASVGFVTIMGRPMATSQDFVNWVCGADLDPEFLMHLFIRSRERFRSLSAGAVHKTVYFPTAMALRVCVPPVIEQRRITARLREQIAEIDRARSALEAQRAAIDALPAALLREVFGPALAALPIPAV